MTDFISIDEELPDKGEDIIGVDSYGNKHYCFKCKCPNTFCAEWRCSLTGFHLSVEILKWKYI